MFAHLAHKGSLWGAYRHFHLENGPATGGIQHHHRAQVQLDKLFNDVQPQPAAVAADLGWGLRKARKNQVFQLGGHAWPVVLHAEQKPVVRHRAQRAADAPARRRELEGVGQQVGQHAGQLGAVHVGTQVLRQVQLERNGPLFRLGRERGPHLLRQRREVGVHIGQGHFVGIDAGQVQQVVHLLQQ